MAAAVEREKSALKVLSYSETGDVWNYAEGEPLENNDWKSLTFEDSQWKKGTSPLGNGEGAEATITHSGAGETAYFRRSFHVEKREQVKDLFLNLLRDDGAIVYLNGIEVFRSNMPDGPVHSQTHAKTSAADAEKSLFFSAAVDPQLLRDGKNVIAVEVHQASPSSSNLSFDLTLKGVIADSHIF